MITVYNIRGTNGSGKSTLARSFICGDPAARPGVDGFPTMVDLHWYAAPTKSIPDRLKPVEGYADEGADLAKIVVGSYRTACGGLDGVPDFSSSFAAVSKAVHLLARMVPPKREMAVLAEGVLASTVWGSWGDYAMKLRQGLTVVPAGQAQVAFCYLDTPVEVCLERIKARQAAAGKVRDINEQMVRDKVRAIAATRARALEAGELVYDLPWETAQAALRAIMTDGLVQTAHDEMTEARVLYRGS